MEVVTFWPGWMAHRVEYLRPRRPPNRRWRASQIESPTTQEGIDAAKRKQKAIDPAATLDQATAAIEAGDKDQARTLLRAYRRWRLAGNAAPPGSDERYGELVDRSGPEIIVRMAEPSPDDLPRPAADVLRPLARLLISMADRIREKYQGVEVDPVAALREAETALERGDLEEAGKHIEDYDGFRVCGGREPPGGKEKHDLLWRRLSALRREPW